MTDGVHPLHGQLTYTIRFFDEDWCELIPIGCQTRDPMVIAYHARKWRQWRIEEDPLGTMEDRLYAKAAGMSVEVEYER